MLENLRDKIINVQHDISNSFRNLATGDASSHRAHRIGNRKDITLNAGADLLYYYQKKWEELHCNDEENAKKAEEVDKLVMELHTYCGQQLYVIQQLNTQLSQLPKLQANILALMEKIGESEGLFEEVEDALLHLEDIIEIQELQEKQLDHRFQLALYKEGKLTDFEKIKTKLAEEHAHNVSSFEKKQQVLLKERQEAFREAFEEEMLHYKTHGKIERLSSTNGAEKNVQLADIELEGDQNALDAFLAEEATEETFSTKENVETIKENITEPAEGSDSNN